MQWMKENHNRFNNIYFNGELDEHKISFDICKSKLYHGRFSWDYYRHTDIYWNCKISMSSLFIHTEKEYEEILIHEMIHEYIRLKNLHDSNKHGYVFMNFAKNINIKSNGYYNITIFAPNANINQENLKNIKIVIFELQNNKNKQFFFKTSANTLQNTIMNHINRFKRINSQTVKIIECQETNKLALLKTHRITANSLSYFDLTDKYKKELNL